MDTFFRTESKDIEDLNSLQLTKLLDLLLRLEARSSGIAERAVEIALNITVADGGEDGRIQWKDGPESTDFLPKRFVQFQNKATDLSPSECAKEIVTSDGSIKPMVEEALDGGAAYIFFINHKYNKEQKDERIARLRKKLMEFGKPYADTAMIDIYDAAKIEGWVNRYVPAIVAVLNWVGRPVAHGLKTWINWGQNPDYMRFSFVSDLERQTALTNLRILLTQSKKCARIVGLSGLGKTRLAFEIFRDSQEYDDLSKRVVYVDANANREIHGLLSDWIQCGLEGILVVDDCDIGLHDRLRQEVQRTDSKLSLLTLDYNLDRSSQTDFIHLKQLQDEYIKKMLEPVYGEEIPDLDRIVSFAQGFPQMAVLLADARLEKEMEMGNLTDELLAHKLLWGGRDSVEQDERVLKGCALFDKFGLDGEVSSEYQFIAKEVVDIEIDQFYECVKRFEERGLIDRRGRYARLIPKPLAIRLAAEWWRRTRREKQIGIINSEMPEGLVESFCEQISRLDFLPEVKTMVEDLCGQQGPFGRAEVILSERGSLIFRALVEVNPEATSNALSSVLKSLDINNLLAIRGDARRNLVWALEKLCFHKVCFIEAANSLLLLASAENESWANNATGQFKQLFRVFLSGTEAPFNLRMNVIDSALRENKSNVKSIAVEALDEALDTYGGSRSIGAEYQGSGAPLEEWRPKVWGEVFEYWNWVLRHLCQLVVNRDVLAGTAKNTIASHIRGLMQYGLVDSLDEVIREVVDSEGPFWPEALDSIKDSLSYEGDDMPPEGKAKLEEWVRLLTPKDLRNRLKLYVTAPPWEHEKEEDGHYIDLAAESAKALAVELASEPNSIVPYLDELLTGEQRMAYWFAKNLVETANKWEPVLSETVTRIARLEKPNISLLLGMLNGVFSLDRNRWEKIIHRLSETEGLIPYYASIANSGEVTENQLHYVVKLAGENKISVISVKIFAYGRALEHQSASVISKFVRDFSDVSDDAAWVALDILSMYCHGSKDKWENFSTVFREIILKVRLDKESGKGRGDIYHWQQTAERLLESEGGKFAIEISSKLIDSCSEELDYSDLWHYLQPLLRKILQRHGREVWPLFADAIRNADRLKRYRLAKLVGSGNSFNKQKLSVLAELNDNLLREWCFHDPDMAPEFVANATEVLIRTEEGIRISPRARFLLDNFGHYKKVLSALSANMGSFGWTGSVVPYYKGELNALEELRDHEKKEVREWVNGRIVYLAKMIERETRRDEEHDWGIL